MDAYTVVLLLVFLLMLVSFAVAVCTDNLVALILTAFSCGAWVIMMGGW